LNSRVAKAEVGGSAEVTPTSRPPILKDNIANLLSTLVKAGVVTASASTASDDARSSIDKESQSAVTADLEKDSSRNYRKAILGQKVHLNSADITRKRPQVLDLLYGQLSVQCKQCGVRFADTTIGKKKMEDHLDMHFRQNRKASQNVGRGHSRSWFIGVEDWMYDSSRDVKGKGREESTRPYNARLAAEEVAKREAELQAQYVVVPPGDEARALSCPICKEPLKTEFLEDVEEWVWKNATKKDDKVYHATCYAEATAVKSSFAARLRSEKLGSRSGTPETQSSRVTPPPTDLRMSRSKSPISPPRESQIAGTKRKVQSDDNSFGGDVTPPFKKTALSS
jgi:pre-mRNA cleavage complex 2 protein Pcf11